MFNDIKRHLRKKGVKTSIFLMSLSIIYYFFKDGRISIFKIIISAVAVIIWFFIFSWGQDNPEDSSTKSKL